MLKLGNKTIKPVSPHDNAEIQRRRANARVCAMFDQENRDMGGDAIEEMRRAIEAEEFAREKQLERERVLKEAGAEGSEFIEGMILPEATR